MPVVDETGLTRLYDWDLEYDWSDPSVIRAGVQAFGLQLIQARRPVEVVVIDPSAPR